MNKAIVFSITALLMIAFHSSSGQALDSISLEKIGSRLVQDELKSREGVFKPGDNCLHDKEGNFLSCLYASSSVNWVTDFNKDGSPDAVFLFTDEGLGGGGNAYGFDYKILLLDKQHRILEQHNIFGGGKFSYGHLEIDEVKNGKIHATYNENPMSRQYDEGQDNLESIPMVFAFIQDEIREESYPSCPLASMKKQIFKKDNGLKIDSILEMDDQFNKAYTEQVTMKDGSSFTASLSGCEDLEIFFSRTIASNASLETNKAAMKQELLNNLQFLKENTLFKTVIQNTYTQVSNLPIQRIPTDKNGGTALHLSLPDRWNAHLFLSGNKEQGSFITIRFEKPKGEEVMSFWESLKSKKRLH